MTTIPTIKQLYDSIIAAMEAEFGVSISIVGKSVLRAIAIVNAGQLKIYYLRLAFIQKNIFVDTADSTSKGGTLERFGRVKLGRNPFQAVAGQYELRVTGTVGAVIDASTVFKSDGSSLNPGKLYILDSAYTLVSSTDFITVRALEPGTDSKLSDLDGLTSTIPIALVDRNVSVNSEVVEPRAAEDLEAYRTAILNSYRLEAQGGAATDFRLWAQDAQGVERVYPYAKSGASAEVNLYVEATVADSTDGKGTPSQSLLDDVEDVIEFNPDATIPLNERGRRPLGIFQVHYLPITVKTVDVTITGYQGNTVEITALLLAAITDMINSIRPFVPAADILSDKNDILDNNRIIAVILTQVPGSVFTSVSIDIDSVTVPTYTFSNGDIPYLNSITYA